MYNSEQYIGECLESILAQTFDDYEVIVVDDCSKDNSCKIVELYIPKFGNRLRLIRSEKNSGGAGTPRNIGIRTAIGDYFFFMDSDDVILPDAFETFYSVAQKFNADVVHYEKWYVTANKYLPDNANDLILNPNLKMDYVQKPTLKSADLAERVTDFCASKFWWAPWCHLIRRNLIAKNALKFSNLSIADDMVFSFCVMILAKRIVHIPGAFYIWRTIEESNSRPSTDVEKTIHKRVGDIFKGIEILDKFMSDIEFFKNFPQHKYNMFNFFTESQIYFLINIFLQVPPYLLEKPVKKELEHIKEKDSLIAFLFNRMNYIYGDLIKAKSLLQQKPQSAQHFQNQQAIIYKQNELIQTQATYIKMLKQQLEQKVSQV